MKKKITPKQEQFVQEYLIDLNATQAAIRAGYSKKSAKEIAYELLTKPHIQQAIDIAVKNRNERIKINADKVLLELVAIKEMDILDILTDSGNLKPISQWPKIWRTTISSFDMTSIGSGDSPAILKKIKWPDKLRNLELIGKHVGIQAWKDKAEADIHGKVSIKYLMNTLQK